MAGVGSLVLACCVLTLIGAQELIIYPSTDTVSKALGTSVLFTCELAGLDQSVDPNLRWFNDSGLQVADRSGRVYIENDGRHACKLYITNIKNSDAGTYTCKGTISGTENSKNILLSLFQEITFVDVPSPQERAINTEANIICRVTGQPQPTVTWRYRGETISTGGKYLQTQDGLKIIGISKSDEGQYTCRATVQAEGKTDQRMITVYVRTPPYDIEGFGEKEGIENQEFSISCKAKGEPSPQYEFFKDDNEFPVRSGDRVTVDTHEGSIHFRPLLYDDRGSYRCKASNSVGNVEATGTLQVLVKPRISSYINQTAVEGQTSELQCYSEGVPPPVITFRKVGNRLDYEEGDNEGGRIRVTKEADGHFKLRIEELIPEDMANYTCKAVNQAGESEQNGTITVYFRPRFNNDHPTHVYSWAGKTRNMTCHVNAEPSPAIKWERFGRQLEDNINNGTFRIYQMFKSSNLQIRVQEIDQGWIYGGYKCVAVNSQGEGSIEIELERATVPGAPRNVSVPKDSASPTRIVLAVEPPERDGGVPVLGYRVEYHQSVADFSVGQEIILENLKASTNYVLHVRARNEVGVGNPVTLSFRTQDMTKPFPIEIISSPEGKYPRNYKIQWARPRTGGQHITKYRIKFRRVEIKNNITTPRETWANREIEDNPAAPRLYYELIHLFPDTYYEVQIVAYNTIGYSDNNKEFVFKTAEGSVDPSATTPKSGQSTPDEGPYPEPSTGDGLSMGAIIGIVIVVIIIFIIIVDVSCYFMVSCGVTMCICRRLQDNSARNEKVLEAGENERIMTAGDATEASETKITEEKELEVEGAPPADGNTADDKKASRKSARLSQNDNPKWKEVMQELQKEISEKKQSPGDEENLEVGEEEDDSKDALKEELQEEEDHMYENTPLTAESKDAKADEKAGEP